jgi:hypothetical protein
MGYAFAGTALESNGRSHGRTQMENERGITIYFVDGTNLRVTFPVQLPNDMAVLLGVQEILKERQIIVESEGSLLIIPFTNVKYIQAFPAPVKLPKTTISGATVVK